MCSTPLCRCQEGPVVPSEVRYDWIPRDILTPIQLNLSQSTMDHRDGRRPEERHTDGSPESECAPDGVHGAFSLGVSLGTRPKGLKKGEHRGPQPGGSDHVPRYQLQWVDSFSDHTPPKLFRGFATQLVWPKIILKSRLLTTVVSLFVTPGDLTSSKARV